MLPEGPLPEGPLAITAEWLNTALPAEILAGSTVVDVRAQDIGEGTGIFGEIARLDLTLDGGSGPTSLIAKMPCVEEANLAVANALGLYDREINMYDQVMDQSPMTAPHRYLADRDDDGKFVLLLEDMSISYDVGDQVTGATLGQAEAIVDALADFHAHWWESPMLADFEWLPAPDAPVYQAAVPDIYRAGLPILQSEWQERVPTAAIALATAIEPRFEELLLRTAGGPRTLIHTDTRLDNIFFAKDGSGAVAFIDFQLALQGRGVADIAYLVGTSIPQAEAAEHWQSLLQRWHDRICAAGITRYAFDDAVTHYKEASMYYLSGAMSLIGSFDTGNERGAAMADAYSTRILNHVVDIDAAAVL